MPLVHTLEVEDTPFYMPLVMCSDPSYMLMEEGSLLSSERVKHSEKKLAFLLLPSNTALTYMSYILMNLSACSLIYKQRF